MHQALDGIGPKNGGESFNLHRQLGVEHAAEAAPQPA